MKNRKMSEMTTFLFISINPINKAIRAITTYRRMFAGPELVTGSIIVELVSKKLFIPNEGIEN
jgi:hypothetical protein